MRTLLAILLVLPLAGCNESNTQPPVRTATYDIHNDDPTGLYVVELLEEECIAIEEDVVVDVIGNTVGVDKVFLRNAVIAFRHKGVPLHNGHYDDTNPDTLHFWMLERTESKLWYFVGTRSQYEKLDHLRQNFILPELHVF